LKEDEELGGQSTPHCGGMAAGGGRKPTYRAKNTNMDVCVFCFLAGHGYGRGLLLPL